MAARKKTGRQWRHEVSSPGSDMECGPEAAFDVEAFFGGASVSDMSSPDQSAQVLQEVGHTIQAYPFKYQGAAILSGQDEGAYGWVTVNYLLENFIKYGFVGRWLRPGRQTVGSLDFGGASTQITFVTKDTVEDERDSKKLRLYGQDYSLYTHSYLCFGRDQVLKRLLANLAKAQGNTDLKPSSSYNSNASLSVMGTGNYDHCLGNVTELFSFNNCRYSQCSFDHVFQPNVSGSFMAFSAFFHIHQFLLSTTGIIVSTPVQLEKAARAVCNMSYDQLLPLAPDQKSRLQDFCAVSLFTKVLFTTGYGFDNTSFPRISFQKNVGDASVGWALGYMLSLSSLLPSESPGLRKALTPGAWMALLVIFTLLIIFTLLYVVLQGCFGKKKGGSDIDS
ncbi:hypothetical protein UPYG_G00282510 [Umbra pygmaea]|uniref:Ectonucleoside triphosphate diphosphohydrolase 2 n=1 Tax=Umbra pygmaea TaxID=75934 RepID=A0ABD0WJ34_UMBPY